MAWACILLCVSATLQSVCGVVSGAWPNPISGFTRNDKPGVLPRWDVFGKDFRHYRHLVAVELLLIHHGFGRCESAGWDDPAQLQRIRAAAEEFQIQSGHQSAALRLNGSFWESLVVPVKPGDKNAAVLALRWLAESTSQATRPPTWDAIQIKRHACQASFDANVVSIVDAALSTAGFSSPNTLNITGLPVATWHQLLGLEEQRVTSGCQNRAIVARIFSIAFIMTWFGTVVVFAVLHEDGWNTLRSESKGTEESPTMLETVLSFTQNLCILFTVMVGQSFAVLGAWSFPVDLVSQLLVSLHFTAGAVATVRLGSRHTRRIGEKGTATYVKAFLLGTSSMLGYLCIMMVPGLHCMWYAAVFTGMMLMWSSATTVVTRECRVRRGILLFIMFLLAAAIPTSFSLLIGVLSQSSLWIIALAPTCLAVLCLLCERPLGRLIEQTCWYTTETNWLLALLFRLCIEIFRFYTALELLVLSLVSDSGFGFLTLYCIQNLIYTLMMRQGHRVIFKKCTDAPKVASAPFYASEIVQQTGDANAWPHRSQAIVLPAEIVLLMSHLCQLLFVGMPVGVSAASWACGLGIFILSSAFREAFLCVLERKWAIARATVPWLKLPIHLLGLIVGVGMTLSIFMQVVFFWSMYAHHWASCFTGGPKNAVIESERDSYLLGAIVMGISGCMLLASNTYSFGSWMVWIKATSVARMPKTGDLVRNSSKMSLGDSDDLVRAFLSASGLGQGQSVDTPLSPKSAPGNLTCSVAVPVLSRSLTSKTLGGQISSKSLTASLSRSLMAHINLAGAKVESEPDAQLLAEGEASEKLAHTWNASLAGLYDESDDDEFDELPGQIQEPSSTISELDTNFAAADAVLHTRHVVETDQAHTQDPLETLSKLLQEVDSRQTTFVPEADVPSASRDDDHEKLLKDMLLEVETADQALEPASVLAAAQPLGTEVSQISLGATLDSAPGGHRWTLEDSDVRQLLASDQGLRALASGEGDAAGVPLESQARSQLVGSSTQEALDKLLDGSVDLHEVEKAFAAEPEKKEAELQAEREQKDNDARERAEDEAEAERFRQEEQERQRLQRESLENERLEKERLEIERLENERRELERLEKERLAQEEADRIERERQEQQRQERERLERERLAREEAERIERERRERERLERERLERERLEREQLEREAAEREAAEREAARRETARQALLAACKERAKDQVEVCLLTVDADGIPEQDVQTALRVLQEIHDGEAKIAAKHILHVACSHKDPDELRAAILRAREVNVTSDVIDKGEARLEQILMEIARLQAASKRLRELLNKPLPGADSSKSAKEQLTNLIDALTTANKCGVEQADIQMAEERKEILQEIHDRDQVMAALDKALSESSVETAKSFLAKARGLGVQDSELVHSEQKLKDLEDAIELANNKEVLLERRIQNAIAAKIRAEQSESSAEVEEVLRDGGVIHVLNVAIQEAKATRMVKKSAIARAEAVAPEIIADIHRILDDKRMQERQLAQQALQGDLEIVKGHQTITALILESLKTSIEMAARFNADTREAERLLADLTKEHERLTADARLALKQALDARLPENIKSCIATCSELLMEQDVEDALLMLRNIINEDIARARAEHDREARLAMVATLTDLLSILRSHGDKQLRGFHNELQDLKGALRVFCRIRPMNGREIKRNDTIAVEMPDQFTVAVDKSEDDNRDPQVFSFDAIFGPSSSQAEVFAECRSLVQSVVDGYNVTVFTYGQTGAGKTWTLYGSGAEPGVSPRICDEIFRVVQRDSQKLRFQITASMIELYLDDLRDLLTRAKTPPELDFKSYRQADGTIGQRLEGVTETPVSSALDLAEVVAQGLGNRKVRATKMNAESSRSHLILVINVEVTDKESGRTCLSKLSIVDLAGSERLGKSGVTGEAQKEAIEINKSLTALGDVMMAFTSKARVIPYRNHKLTRLMQDSLGGTAKTLMFVNISPSSSNAPESINSLQYAARARCIENDVSVQQGNGNGGRRSRR
eukprot:TRINITY_DN41272_c0_g1_i1.p1 TRINITY_DN41272_c0_g1~~TRINITY_DN41272_c0_g1_i1.p1  ORF type:complete len:1998 (-),score=388.66 TRINITY_DN41272_c0_g1_i1:390-6383(-)